METCELVTLESVALPNFCRAYEALRPLLVNHPPGPRVQRIPAIPQLVSRVLTSWPLLYAHRDALLATQPQLMPGDFERLQLLALALGHAELLCQTTAADSNHEPTRHRDVLLGLVVATYSALQKTWSAWCAGDERLLAAVPPLDD